MRGPGNRAFENAIDSIGSDHEDNPGTNSGSKHLPEFFDVPEMGDDDSFISDLDDGEWW